MQGGDLLSTTWVKNFWTLKYTNNFLGFFLLALCQPKSRVGPGAMLLLLLSQLSKYEPTTVPCRTWCDVVVVVAIEKI